MPDLSPAEHYAEAERLAKLALGDFPANPIAAEVVALAQVHATLATTDADVLWPLRGVAAGPQATPDQVHALRQLHEAATPAPWDVGPDRRSNATVTAPSREAAGLLAEVALCPWQPEGGQHVDALLIAAMRNALPLLLGGVVAVPTDHEDQPDAR